MSDFTLDESILSMLAETDLEIENNKPKFSWAREGSTFLKPDSGTYVVVKATLQQTKTSGAPIIKLHLAKDIGDDKYSIYTHTVFIPVKSANEKANKMLAINKKQVTTLALLGDNAPLTDCVKEIMTNFNKATFTLEIETKETFSKDGREYLNVYFKSPQLTDSLDSVRADIIKYLNDSEARKAEKAKGLQTETVRSEVDENASPF